ncbi:MAG: hypothetical protein LBI12_02710, partial [Treponema sp.]|nr:hypothetical protein [Treponema sp.]
MITDKETLLKKTILLLEYPRIMEKAASFALSEEAALLLKESTPFYETEKVHETKKITEAIFSLIKSGNDEPKAWLPSIGFLLPKMEVSGIVLDLDEVLAIGLFVERAADLRKWIMKDRTGRETESPGRQTLLAMLNHENFSDCSPATDEIFKIIDRDGNLRDLPA